MAKFTVTCPHCQAQLELDGDNQVVVSCKVPEKPKSTTTIEDRLSALSRERETAKAKMEEAMRSEQAGSQVREERFRKLLEGAQAEPPTKPIRDIDLD
jgi:uncharacterized Zn finger protein (UPF0148 family)